MPRFLIHANAAAFVFTDVIVAKVWSDTRNLLGTAVDVAGVDAVSNDLFAFWHVVIIATSER